MKQTFFLLLIFTGMTVLHAQNGMPVVLKQVEENNPTLKVLKQNLEAEKTGNKTGILPDNPEAGYGYLWGNPAMIGNRTDVNVKQSFDFPSAYLYKSQMSGIKNKQAESVYRQNRSEILLQAKVICIELIYCNTLLAENARRLKQAEKIAEAYQIRYKAGDSGLPDFNKAQLDLLNTRQEFSRLQSEQKSLFTRLTGMNGGNPVELKDTVFPVPVIPSGFDEWYQQVENRHPGLQYLQQETELTRKEIGLAASLALPGLNAGYMSEKVTGEHFRGVTAGLTIPLWAGKNTIRYARLKNMAAVEAGHAGQISVRYEMKALYDKAVELRDLLSDYRKNLTSFDNSALLMKALNLGEISLIDYILELSVWYQSRAKALELERDLHKVLAELEQYN